jgi:ionotropic glutamate receptor NMDA 1
MGIFQKENRRPKNWLLILLLWTSVFCFSAALKQNKIIRLGAMFSSENVTVLLKDRLRIINKNLTSSNVSLRFEAVTFPMDSSNPIRAALDACENILNEHVYVVFVNQDNMTNDAVIGISYTCGFFQVPVVGIGVRDAIFSDRVSACILKYMCKYLGFGISLERTKGFL